MYAIEFQAPIKDGAVHLPKNYQGLYESQKVQIFIMPIKEKNRKIEGSFDPKEFFGVVKNSKDKIDQYLQSSQSEWDNYLDEK